MTLQEAIAKCDCDVLKKKLNQFLVDISGNAINTTDCPVCGSSLIQTYAPSAKRPWRGTCTRCHLGIQMHHSILHEEHLKIDLTICGYQLNLPVALCTPEQVFRLHARWVAMGLPGVALGQTVLPLSKRHEDAWMTEVQSIVKTFDPERSMLQ